MLSLQNRKTLFAALLICSILLTGWFAATALPLFCIYLCRLQYRPGDHFWAYRTLAPGGQTDPGESYSCNARGMAAGERFRPHLHRGDHRIHLRCDHRFQGGPMGAGRSGGSRLLEITIDRKSIILTFGTEAKTAKLELLHGLTEIEAAVRLQDDFMFETGVKAKTTWSKA